MGHLTLLDLEQNALHSLPDAVGSCKSLVTLCVSNNKLRVRTTWSARAFEMVCCLPRACRGCSLRSQAMHQGAAGYDSLQTGNENRSYLTPCRLQHTHRAHFCSCCTSCAAACQTASCAWSLRVYCAPGVCASNDSQVSLKRHTSPTSTCADSATSTRPLHQPRRAHLWPQQPH